MCVVTCSCLRGGCFHDFVKWYNYNSRTSIGELVFELSEIFPHLNNEMLRSRLAVLQTEKVWTAIQS